MIEPKEMIEKLEYAYKLMRAMDNMNQEEIKERNNYIELPALPPAPRQTWKQRKRSWYLACLAAAFVLLALLEIWATSSSIMFQRERDYQAALINDKFDWEVNYAKEGEEYPGYRGDILPYTRGGAMLRALPIAIAEAVFYTAAGAAIVFVWLKVKNAGKKAEYKTAMDKYGQIAQKYHTIQAENRKTYERIEGIHSRKKAISSEYLANVSNLLPEEYCNMDAVGYFIREFKDGLANTLPEAIKSYRQYQHNRKMECKMDRMLNNQEIARQQREELITQQMIGNFISFATFLETSRIAADSSYFHRYVTGTLRENER